MTARSAPPTAWTHEHSCQIQADAPTVLTLLAEVELWPALFRHIRSAQVLKRDGRRRLIAVRANWCRVPFGYTAIQTVDDAAQVVSIEHISWLTRGSLTTWRVRPIGGGLGQGGAVDVTVRETVRGPLPGIGGHIVRDLSESMLLRLKEIAEGGSLAGRD